MAADLDDLAVVHDDDAVGLFDGGEAMKNQWGQTRMALS